MTKWFFIFALCSCSLVGSAMAAAPQVAIETSLGTILVEIYPDKAPLSANNFLRYVDEGRFEGAHFYRVVHMDNQPKNQVKIEVIQGGLGEIGQEQRLPAIEHETTREIGLRHVDGALSMARAAPGSASSEFFICIGDQPELDFGGKRNPDGQGFSVFGQVVEGMEFVRAIQKRPEKGQMLIEVVPATLRRTTAK